MTNNFEKTVKAMSAKEIIMSMVKGLQNPKVKVDMKTFGKFRDGICYGGASTNMICQISSKTFTDDNISKLENRANFLYVEWRFLSCFEMAINELRQGYIDGYNYYSYHIDTPLIKDNGLPLPNLRNKYTRGQLQHYVNLTNTQ